MSDDLRRVVRKLQPAGPRSFDEETWPIYVALIVLGGYVIGVILSVLQADDARWYANAITWIAAVSLALVAAVWCVHRLQYSLLRKTLLFSLLISLIINLSFLVVMALTSIFSPFWEQDRAKAITKRDREEVVVPEYAVQQPFQAEPEVQPHERPVETGEAEAQPTPEIVQQREIHQVPEEAQAAAPATESPQQQTAQLPARADTPSTPRRNETLSKLSRQTLQAEPQLSRMPDLPVQPRPAPAASRALASATDTAKRATEARSAQMPTEVDVAPRRLERTELARRQDSEVPPQVASQPLLTQALRRPRALPNTATPVDAGETRPQQRQEAVQAHSTLAQKQSTSAPPRETDVTLAPQVTPQLDRARPRAPGPVSATVAPSVVRRELAARAPATTAAEAPDSASAPSPVELASSSSAQVQQRTENLSPAQLPSPEITPQVAATLARQSRQPSTDPPSVSRALASSRRSVARANRVTQRSVSPQASASSAVPATAQQDRPQPSAEPSRLALSRSAMGMAGVGDANNLERGVAAPDTAVNVASASANRQRATQTAEPGPALAPSARSVNRQLRANLDLARNSLRAQDVETAVLPGAPDPAAQAASSAATVEQSRSNAAADTTTAARGAAEVDLGPTRVAADTGSGRAEGGGQPELSGGEQPRVLKRSDQLAGQATVSATARAEEVEAPAAQQSAPAAATPAPGTSLARSANAPAEAGASSSGSRAPEVNSPGPSAPSGARAQAQANTAPAVAGGGLQTPGRQARSLQISSPLESSVPELAGTESSAGSPRGTPLDAQGDVVRQAAAGLLTTTPQRVGAAAGSVPVEGSAESRLPSPSWQRVTSGEGEVGNQIAVTSASRGAPRRQNRSAVAGGTTDVELDPEDFAVNTPGGQSFTDDLEGTVGDLRVDHVSTSAGGALVVDADAPEGAGGLDVAPSLDAGIYSRRAQAESTMVHVQPERFLTRSRPSAAAVSATSVALPTEAFQRRITRRGEPRGGQSGLPSPKTEEAIELGLGFLARFQSSDGSWSLHNFADGKARLPDGEEPIMVSDTAATGLALLSFLGAGYHHRDDQYQEVVRGGLNFLLDHQKETGDLYIDQDPNSSRSAWLYSHGIAAIALCEAYGMTQDPDLREPAQKAIEFIAAAQHPTRGGWRYSPAYGSDTSVSGWMSMALKSGQLAGLDVPESAYARLRHWLDLAQDSDARPYLFRYNPYAPDTTQQRHGRTATRAMTAVGLLARLYTGWRRDDPNMILGAQTLTQNLPEMGTSSRPRRDTYYWYYATQVMYHMGGDHWEAWNQKLHPLLTDTQLTEGTLAGSWNPLTPIPDRWGAHGGRLYVTSLNLLSLEVFYRHLPIYEETSK